MQGSIAPAQFGQQLAVFLDLIAALKTPDKTLKQLKQLADDAAAAQQKLDEQANEQRLHGLELDALDKTMREKQQQLKEQESDLKTRHAALDEMQNTLEAHAADLAKKANDHELRATKVNAELSRVTAEFNAKSQAKTVELNKREKELDAREKDVIVLEAQVKRAKDEIDERLRRIQEAAQGA